MLELLRRTRRLWLMSARHDDPSSYNNLVAQGIVTIGEHSYGQPRVVTWFSPTHGQMGANVKIGRYCSIAGGVTIMTGGNHRPDWVSSFPMRLRLDLAGKEEDGAFQTRGDVMIGNDVWIGENALILSGVTVGHGAVIGAGAVVAKDVAPYAIVVGSPAREIRKRFTDEQIAALLRIAWWDWPIEKVRSNVALLNGAAIEDFLSEHQAARP